MPWGLRRRREPVDGAGDRVQDARRLRVRTRRQVTDLFAGHYVSAFRGTGIEYTESRPYVPGDDVRSFDWNATARTGVPHVKQHRPERGRTIVAAIDASSTMRFGTGSKTKLEAAADAVALLATAALAVGDRFGVLVHDEDGVHELAPRRGELQLHLLLDVLTGDASHGQRAPCVQGALPSLLEKRRRRGEIVFRFGDARGEDGARSFTSSRRAGASSVAA